MCFAQQRKRLNSQRWASSEEHVNDGDLGLGTVAQLDICTGTAVCSRASGSNMDTLEGGKRESLLFQPTACRHTQSVVNGSCL